MMSRPADTVSRLQSRNGLRGLLLAAGGLALLPACTKESDSPPGPAQTGLELRSDLPRDPGKASVVKLQQISLPAGEETFRIPDFGTYQTDYVQERENLPLVDILIVIDNSGSMSEEQAKVAAKMEPLLEELYMADWQINVITTDDPCPTREGLPFTSKTEELATEFEKAIKVGTGGSGDEKPLLMTLNHLQGKGECAGGPPNAWLRDDAKLAVFFLTDEDETKTEVTPDLFIEALAAIDKPVGTKSKLYSIITHPSQPCKTADLATGALILAELMEKAPGIWGDICKNDYTDMLSTISGDIAKFFQTSILLMGPPVSDEITVTLNGQDYGSTHWEVVGDRFILKEALDTGSYVVITYKIGEVRSLFLKTGGLPGDVTVKVSGEEMPSSDFAFKADEKAVSFQNALPGGKVVQVSYKDQSQLPAVFPFLPLEEPDRMNCYVNGTPAEHIYFPGEDFIRFAPPPPEDALITCLYP